MKVAAERAFDQSITVFPAEVARGVYVKHVPSLQASKLLHLMIAVAGGRMADEMMHEMRLSEISKIEGMRNHTRASLTPLFSELAAAVLIYDNPEKMRVKIGGILDEADIDYRQEASGELVVQWSFRRTFRQMAADSNHWAILDRQTAFHLDSKYSTLLFQHISSLARLRYIDSKQFPLDDLRAMLGIEEDKITRFSTLNQRILKPAIDKINHLTRLELTATPKKIGRTVVSVEIAWREKEDPRETKRELAASKIGREARRLGTADVIPAVFPETGGITYSPRWLELKCAAGCNADNAKIASDFRRFLEQRGIARDARNIETLFSDFCRTVGKVST